MRTFEYQLVTNGNMNATITSAPQQVGQMVMACVQAVFTGSSPTGTFKIQVSNNHKEYPPSNDVITDGDWTDYTGSEYAITASGSYVWNFATLPFPFFRVVYTRVSGTGTLQVYVNGKGV